MLRLKTFVVIFVWMLWNKFKFATWSYPYRGYIIALFALMLIASWIHMGCQEMIYTQRSGKETSPSLHWYKAACPNPTKFIQFTRWVGSSFVVAFATGLFVAFGLKW